MSDDTVQAWAFKSVLGKDYAIVAEGPWSRLGDAYEYGFPILEDGRRSFIAAVSVSETLFETTWKLTAPENQKRFIALCFAHLSSALEREVLAPKNARVAFTSDNTSEVLELAVRRAEADRDAVCQEIREFIKIASGSRERSSGKSLETMRDHVEFQERKAVELRGVYLQVASVSAAIVGAVLALSTPFSCAVAGALLLLALVVAACFWRVSSALQDISIQVFERHRAIQALYDKTIARDAAFLESPSYLGIQSLKDDWKKIADEVRAHPKIENINRDNWLIGIQVVFTVAIGLLFVAYVERRGTTSPQASAITSSPEKSVMKEASLVKQVPQDSKKRIPSHSLDRPAVR